jgi:hypothetical protein
MANPKESVITRLELLTRVKATQTTIGTGNQEVTAANFDEPAGVIYNPDSDTPVTRISQDVRVLASGTETIDLTDLPGLQDNIDGDGLTVRGYRIKGDTDNVGGLTIATGASNGYVLFGAGNELDIDNDGEEMAIFQDEKAPISATVKNLDLTGTIGDTWKIEIWMG